jgi:signal transduction histidine kinase
MKLLNRINRQFTLLSLPVLVLILIPVYFVVLTIQENEISEGLKASENWVENAIRENGKLVELYPVIDVKVGNFTGQSIIKDTLVLDPVENDLELFKELITPVNINGIQYQITVRAYGLEKRNLAFLLFLVFLVLAVLVNITLIVINRHVSRSVWRPLEDTLQKIRNFSIQRHEPINLSETNIDEFRSLNSEINKLSFRILSDYQNIKQFSENAAHELQTPLAIIRNKVDTLLATSGLSEEQTALTASIEESIDRLNRLNRGLLQLSRIDNGQYSNYQKSSSAELIRSVTDEFKEIFELRSISLEIICLTDQIMVIDPDLARILFNNLINNAIKYTTPPGKVTIKIWKNEIRVSNTGLSALSGGDKIFNRFYRENQSQYSTGLGLALVKSICMANSLEVRYEFSDGYHHFILTLPSL